MWRTWLLTGARSHAIDRRRLRGAHHGLKQILAEGGEPDAVGRPWRNFSHAMARQSVNEAMARLESRQRVVITLAYFAGFSNDEIGKEVGLTARGVQRTLSQAIDRLNDLIDRGRRAILAFGLVLAGSRVARWAYEVAGPAGVQVVAAAVVVVTMAAGPLAPATNRAATPAGEASATVADTASTADRAAVQTKQAAAAAPATATSAPASGTAVSIPGTSLPAVSVPAIPAVDVPIAKPALPAVKLPKLSI